jgi:hypothetical protein
MKYKGLSLCSEEPTAGLSIISLIIQNPHSFIYLRSILLISYNLHLGLPLNFFPSGLSTKTCMHTSYETH